jgi:hypothetical protein
MRTLDIGHWSSAVALAISIPALCYLKKHRAAHSLISKHASAARVLAKPHTPLDGRLLVEIVAAASSFGASPIRSDRVGS